MPVNANSTRAAIHGDREAFEMIIRTHSRTLFAIAYGILQNREEAEDVVQDSLVKAWKMRWRVRDPEKFPAWLSMIARHRAHDVFRKRRPVPFTHETIETTEANTPDTSGNGSTITLGARHVTGATSRRAHSSLFRRDGLSDDRKHARPNEWRAARNSRPRSGFAAQTTSPRSRFNGLNLWQSFTTKSTTGSLPIFTANSPMKSSASCILISSSAPRAEKLIRKPKQ